MKKISRIIALVLISTVVFAACGKYEDGPKISLATKKARLVNKWQTESMCRNGVSISLHDEDGYIEFKKDGKVVSFTSVGGASLTTDLGTWEFSDNKEEVCMTETYGGVSVTTSMKIIRLKSNELWVSYVEDGETLEIHYKTYKK